MTWRDGALVEMAIIGLALCGAVLMVALWEILGTGIGDWWHNRRYRKLSPSESDERSILDNYERYVSEATYRLTGLRWIPLPRRECGCIKVDEQMHYCGGVYKGPRSSTWNARAVDKLIKTVAGNKLLEPEDLPKARKTIDHKPEHEVIETTTISERGRRYFCTDCNAELPKTEDGRAWLGRF